MQHTREGEAIFIYGTYGTYLRTSICLNPLSVFFTSKSLTIIRFTQLVGEEHQHRGLGKSLWLSLHKIIVCPIQRNARNANLNSAILPERP
jgi:hypothetical protein